MERDLQNETVDDGILERKLDHKVLCSFADHFTCFGLSDHLYGDFSNI